jgi:hypothetical protein
MRLYPASAGGRTRTLAGDLTVLALLILFAWLGVKVHDAILELTSIGRSIQDSGRAVAATTRNTAGAVENAFSGAAGKVQGLPVVGGDLANALRDAPRGATDPLRETGDEEGARIVRLGVEQVNRTEQAANWAGWLVFLLPASMLVLWRLPPRVRLIHRLSTAQRVLTGAPEDILAARAAYNLPYETLRRYTKDPFGDLAAGRHGALLTALEDDAGVRLPTPPPTSTSRSPRPA